MSSQIKYNNLVSCCLLLASFLFSDYSLKAASSEFPESEKKPPLSNAVNPLERLREIDREIIRNELERLSTISLTRMSSASHGDMNIIRQLGMENKGLELEARNIIQSNAELVYPETFYDCPGGFFNYKTVKTPVTKIFEREIAERKRQELLQQQRFKEQEPERKRQQLLQQQRFKEQELERKRQQQFYEHQALLREKFRELLNQEQITPFVDNWVESNSTLLTKLDKVGLLSHDVGNLTNWAKKADFYKPSHIGAAIKNINEALEKHRNSLLPDELNTLNELVSKVDSIYKIAIEGESNLFY